MIAWWDGLSLSHAAIPPLALFVLIVFVWTLRAGRKHRRRRSLHRAYSRYDDGRPHHSAQRNGTEAVP